MQRAINALSRRWRFRHEYSRLRDWLLSYYDSIVRRYKSVPLPLRDRVLGLSLKVSDRPFYVRVGRADGFILEEIFLRKVYDPLIHADLGDVRQIVDLGGNVGMTVRLWQMCFPKARILVVEPDPGNYELCQKNSGNGASTNVSLVQACVGATARQAYLDTNRSECMFQMVDQPADQSKEVVVKTMPQVLQECGMSGEIDLLKCDIEGAERELFSDCAAWIGSVRNLLIEIHGDYTKHTLEQDLKRNGADFAITAQGQESVLLLQRQGQPAAARS